MTVNQRVLGSSPRGGATKMIKPLYCYSVAVFLFLSNENIISPIINSVIRFMR